MRNTAIVLAVVAVVALAVPAFGATYITTNWSNAGTDSWHVDGNWDNNAPDSPPATGEYWHVYISNGGTAQISANADANKLYFGKYNVGHLEMLAGTYTLGATGGVGELRVGFNGLASLGVSTFTQYGGDFYSGSSMQVATGGWDSRARPCGSGQWTIEGGSVGQRNAQYRYMTVGANGGGNYTGYGFDYGIGRLKVVGTGPTSIQFNCYTQNPGSTLEAVLDADGNITPIQVTGTAHVDYDDATLAGTLELVVDYTSFTPVANVTTIPILTVDGTGALTTTGLTLVETNTDPNGGHWVMLDNDGVGGDLEVQYVPEPATMVLLGLGGIGVLIRRRRRA